MDEWNNSGWEEGNEWNDTSEELTTPDSDWYSPYTSPDTVYNDNDYIPQQIDAPVGNNWAPQMNSSEMLASLQVPDTNWNPNSQPQSNMQGLIASLFGGNKNATSAEQAAGNGAQSFLQQLFGGIGAGAGGLLGSGSRIAAAVAEGNQNKQKQQALNQIAQTPALDPFSNQRPFYQQQAQQTVMNPYSSPIVTAQVQQIQKAQNIKDAAAGRRSNSVGSAPAVIAAQAKIAQDYMNSMMQAGGSNIAPNSSAISNLLSQGVNAGINGYISPISSAIGYETQAQSTQAALDAIAKLLNKNA